MVMGDIFAWERAMAADLDGTRCKGREKVRHDYNNPMKGNRERAND